MEHFNHFYLYFSLILVSCKSEGKDVYTSYSWKLEVFRKMGEDEEREREKQSCHQAITPQTCC